MVLGVYVRVGYGDGGETQLNVTEKTGEMLLRMGVLGVSGVSGV